MKNQEQYWVLGDLYMFHLSTPELAIIEVESSLHHGPPSHTHTIEAEAFYVLEGKPEVLRGEERFVVTKGDLVYFGKGVLHRFRTVSGEGSRILVTLSPGTFAQLFREIGCKNADEAQDPEMLRRSQERLIALSEQYGLEIAAPLAA